MYVYLLYMLCNERDHRDENIISINNRNSFKTLATAHTELTVTQPTSRLLRTHRGRNICRRVHTLGDKCCAPLNPLSWMSTFGFLSVCPSVCPYACCLCICLCVCPTVCLSICQSGCVFVWQIDCFGTTKLLEGLRRVQSPKAGERDAGACSLMFQWTGHRLRSIATEPA